ncbi:hypothetical protein [Nocardioides deserti]|uniref:Uncharacterized protein n=1 Tax=Nocardioides deserti TaxID=1588644 RepID=A0ABR6U774_9ACTN|nr:hypothetical protein [Nocardioides deserti]MBC2960285.1 hypothetical protein [Nocardioides deserti]GGO71851.1 hypothetical protein GCM10012276_13810 [Nocardioides deserti]
MTGSPPDKGPYQADDGSGSPADAPAGPWWQRGVLVAVVGMVAVTAVVLTLPDREVELSTGRAPQPFVELALTSAPRATCGDGSVRVRFRMTSHLEEREALRYRVAVDPSGPRAETVRRRGKVRLAPGESTAVRVRLANVPDGPHDVTVRLRHRPERLRVHCDPSRR